MIQSYFFFLGSESKVKSSVPTTRSTMSGHPGQSEPIVMDEEILLEALEEEEDPEDQAADITEKEEIQFNEVLKLSLENKGENNHKISIVVSVYDFVLDIGI